MSEQADSLVSSREDWDTYKTWSLQLAPSADLYKKAKLVREASRKLAVGIGFDQDADNDMKFQSQGYEGFLCTNSSLLNEAKGDLSKGKSNIKDGLKALKTAVWAER